MAKLQIIDASELVRYNANARGNSSPDCVARGLSLVFSMTYDNTLKELRQIQKDHHRDSYKTFVTIEEFIANHCSDKCIELKKSEYVPVGEFADTHPAGTYIILCGKHSANFSTEHLVTVIDGKIYDSWDSRDYFVKKYWSVSNVTHEFKLNLEAEKETLREQAMSDIDLFGRKFCEKYNIPVDEVAFQRMNFKYNVLRVHLVWKSSKTGKAYDFSFNLSYSLKMSIDEALKYTTTTIKTRLYDRFYTSSKQDAEEYEAKKLFEESGETEQTMFYMDDREKRFFNSLPAKIKPFVKYISIQSPGQYSDSVSVRIKALPGDPRRSTDPSFRFEGYDSAMVKDMIKRYLEKWERPYDDYEPYEEY